MLPHKLHMFAFAFVVVSAVAARLLARVYLQVQIPSHLLGHTAVAVPELFDEATQHELLSLLKQKRKIPSNNADRNFYNSVHEHIGEAQPIELDGTCLHPYLVPNQNHTLCILPGRIDIAFNYAFTGGYNGQKENLRTLFSRLQSFGLYIFDLDLAEHAVIRKLFNSEKFLSAASEVCPKSKQYLDPFQFNFIVQVPGQTVATHVDGVYFYGASRFQLPQWLLAVMHFSGLFEDQFIHQVQVVGYASDWDSTAVKLEPQKYGEFVFWNGTSDDEVKFPPVPRSGNAIDGSKVVHTTTLFRPDVIPPSLDKNKENQLQYNTTTERWDLFSGNEVLASYRTEELRISIVYRARCFENENSAQAYKHSIANKAFGAVDLEAILLRLIENGEKISQTSAPTDSRLDLALWLNKVFIKYPMPPMSQTFFPINYCAIFKSPNPIC